MIAWDRITELQDEIGEDGFAEVLDLFLSEVETALAGVCPGDPPEKVECAMHFLKGCASNLGLSTFSALCAQYELAAAGGKTDSVDQVALQQVYANSRDLLLGHLQQQAAT